MRNRPPLFALLSALLLSLTVSPAFAQTTLLGTYTWPTTTPANSTPGGAFLPGEIDVFGGRATASAGQLQIAGEGSNSLTRDLLFFNALPTTAAAQKAVVRAAGYYVTGTCLFYDAATNHSYVVIAEMNSTPPVLVLHKTAGSPASSDTVLQSVSLPAGTAWVAGDAIALVAAANGAGASSTLTYALFDMTHPAAGQPSAPVNVTDAGAIISGSYTDNASAYVSGGYALPAEYYGGGTTTFSQVQFFGPAPGLQPCYVSSGPATTLSVPLSWTAATGGTGTVTYSVYRSLTAGFAAGSGSRIFGPSSALSYADAPPDHQPYYYAVQATDGSATPAVTTSNQAAGETLLGPAGLAVGFIGTSEIYGLGDSALGNLGVVAVAPSGNLSAGGSVASAVQILLSQTGGLRDVTCYNAGGVGSTAQQWSAAQGGYLYPAIAAFPSGCPVVFQCGKNDAKDATATSKSAFKSYISGAVAYIVGQGHPVVLLPEFYVVPGSFSGAWTNGANELIRQYDAALGEIVAADTTGRVQIAAPNLFDFSVAHNDTTWLVDGVHGSDRFSVAEAALLAPPLSRLLSLTPAASAAGLVLTVTGTGTSRTLNWTADSLASLYKVKRSTDGINYVVIATTAPGTRTYTDTARPTGTVYYTVSAVH